MSLPNPHNVPTEYDVILTPPPDVPGWSQNIQFSCHLGEPGGGLWTHASSIGNQSPPLWEMVLTVLLPDGGVLNARTFGRSADPALASSGPHTLRVDRPLEQWSMRYDGVARRIRPADCTAAPVPEGPVEPVTVDLVITALTPIWSLGHAGGAMEAQDWAKIHTEQGIRVTGTITTVDGELEFDHHGIRDVSVGTRNFDSLMGHTWASCRFPDGRFFGAYHVRSAGDIPDITHGLYWDGSTLHDISGVRTEPLTCPANHPQRTEIHFEGPDGPVKIGAEVQHHMPFTLESAGRIIPGVDLVNCDLFVTESAARYDWDGVVGLGWLERSARASAVGLR